MSPQPMDATVLTATGERAERTARAAAAARALAAAEQAAGLRGDAGTHDAAPGHAGSRAAAPRRVGPPLGGPEPSSRGKPGVVPGGASDGGVAGEESGGDPDAVARSIVLRQLSMAPRSRAQLAAKLRQRQCPDEVAARVLDRFQDAGLIDDAAFAEQLTYSRRATKGLARNALRHELRAKGVEDHLIEAAVGAITPGEERVKAEELAYRKLATMGGLEPKVQARRLAGMLMRKGYSSDIVYAVVRDLMESAPELQRD